MLNSNQQAVREDLPYSKEDIDHVIEWTKVSFDNSIVSGL
jgi:hypothetical protein